MYSLEVIKAINSNPRKIIDHRNVLCGHHEIKAGIILHSARLRSTILLTDEECKAAFRSWKGKREKSEWIEAYFLDQTVEGGNLGVLRYKRPRWTFAAVTGKGSTIYQATSRERIPTRHASLSARLLSTLTR